jgi:hypothetical protein
MAWAQQVLTCGPQSNRGNEPDCQAPKEQSTVYNMNHNSYIHAA